MKKFAQKLKESTFAVLPITVVVLALGITLGGMNMETVLGFLVGAVMLVIGMSFFTLGADIAMMPMGETIGSTLTKTKKLWLILIVSFITGVLVTIAEPGLLVLAERFASGMDNAAAAKTVLVMVVGIGVGLFLLISMIKTIFQIDLNKLLIVFYGLMFVLAIIISIMGKPILSVAFDSGGATTGAITVPFIMAYGIGIASIKGNERAEDSFGYIALASIGPILAVLIWGVFSTTPTEFPSESGGFNILDYILKLPDSLMEVLIPLATIFAFFLLFQFLLIKLPRSKLVRILIGVFYTLIGLTLFLTGANIGFYPVGNALGQQIGSTDYNWILIPIGILVGCFIVAAEPAIVVLNEKVEEISGGTITKRTMLISLMAAIGIAVGLAMLRALYGISIWWMIAPGYLISLALTFFVPKVFTAVAFDSGGVASGPMTSAFLLPFVMGACSAVEGNILTDAFGVIAMVAMMPLVTIQIVGLIAKIKMSKFVKPQTQLVDDYEIVELA